MEYLCFETAPLSYSSGISSLEVHRWPSVANGKLFLLRFGLKSKFFIVFAYNEAQFNLLLCHRFQQLLCKFLFFTISSLYIFHNFFLTASSVCYFRVAFWNRPAAKNSLHRIGLVLHWEFIK